MKIISAEFVTSVGLISQLPKDGLPEIAFAGRSNVGKSSLLNNLFNRKKLAKVSSTPGKTRTLNFYKVNDNMYFVDLPGYGYAKVSKSLHAEWKMLVEKYMETSTRLKGVVVLTDMRHPITALDLELLEWLKYVSIPFAVVGTKSDKLSGNKLAVRMKDNLATLKSLGTDKMIPFSIVSGRGKAELLKELDFMVRRDE
ncbi:MAG: YihA family ribosome biogenesis GTP-binding protein [Calditrichaeota bacterium]|nr:YihA family ribosome biogenesis GTP-binding protein [Calditrichota bacterium]